MNPRELRELAVACACHVAVRLALRTVRFKIFLRLARLRLPASRHRLSLPHVQRLAHRSRRLCAGSCLTETVVMRLLAARHGHPVPALTIGVARAAGVFRAHAWTDGDAGGFTPLWSEPREPEKPWLV